MMKQLNGNHALWSIVKWEAPACPDGVTNEAEHRVALLGRQPDWESVLLAKFGMSAKTIAQFTGLNPSQVNYRLKKAGIKISDFRNGRGEYAEIVFKNTARRAAAMLTHELRQLELNGSAHR